MSHNPTDELETDARFPSGPWTGFFLQKFPPVGRQMMEMRLTFQSGVLQGEGRDVVGAFLFKGRYDLADGRCYWTKRYLGKHDVSYEGFNEGKGIWGTWEIPPGPYLPALHGGFHIWPEGMADPCEPELSTSASVPADDAVVHIIDPFEEPVPAHSQSAAVFRQWRRLLGRWSAVRWKNRGSLQCYLSA
jgi:hypothetical protein